MLRYAGGGEYRGAFCRDARHGAGELRDAAGALLYAGAWESDARAGQVHATGSEFGAITLTLALPLPLNPSPNPHPYP